MMSDRRALNALLRSNFPAFVQKTFGTLSPGQTYIPSWHLDAIAYQLERVRRGEIKRLIINMPPRSLKSIMASVAFPAFLLGHDPTKRVICVSYSGDLSKKHSNDFRAVLESSWYRELFPGSDIGPFKNNETEIELAARGFRLATSIGGTLTGRGGDILIVDDPLKPEDAHSDAKREGANQWFANTLLSRLDDKRHGAIIIVMQRLHMNDLTGFLLSQTDEWEVLQLPAIATCDQDVNLGYRTHHRKADEVLSPEREPLAVLENIKRTLGSEAFSAQYQQQPVPPGGAMIQRDWIKRYDELPPASEQLYVLQSWDTASKGEPDNDWSVCTTWLVCRDTRRFLLHVWRQRVQYPALKANVIRLATEYRARKVLIEDTGTGTPLVQELRGRISGVVPIRPEGDKRSRMAAVSARFEAGEIYLPKSKPWLPDLEAELFAFPGVQHDDQCDSISQALGNDKVPFYFNISDELLAQSKIPDPRFRRYRF